MPLPITIPNTFANATATIPLTQLDNNFSTVAVAVNSIGNGAFSLANAQITGGTISNVTLDNVSVDVETLSNVTITNLTVNGNATFTNAAVTANTATITTANVTTANVTNMVTGNATITGGTINVASVIATDDVTVGDDLVFTGTGNRITGDFSNATIANRVMFQTSTVNGTTSIATLPNGTNATSSVLAFGGSDPANAPFTGFNNTATESQILASKIGTGTYLPMTFYTGGSERMRVDTSGNVGIGTSSPSSPLNVVSASSSLAIAINGRSSDSLGAMYFYANNGSTQYATITTSATEFRLSSVPAAAVQTFYTNGSERARIDSSGNVGIGTTTPSTYGNGLVVYNASTGVVRSVGGSITAYMFASSGGGLAAAGTETNHPFALYTNSSERARIDSSGNLCVGRSSVGAGDRFVVQTIASGTIMLGYNSSATNTYQVLESGNVLNTNNSYGAISDQRRKENIVDATPKLEKLNQVRIVNFNIIGDGQKQIGVVAQELEQIFPGMVEEDQEGIKAVKYSVFVPMLIKSIQEQQQMIETLQAEVAALKGA
jgi:hypothetical protein